MKCDEKGPPCTSCATRQTQCAYSNSTEIEFQSYSISKPGASSPDVRNAGPLTQSDEASIGELHSRSATTLLELQLLHLYLTSTHKTLGELFESPDSLWQDYVIQEAFKHDFLLNGILSLAALHKASQEMKPASKYTVKASEYLTVALKEFRRLLNSPETGNVDSMYAFATIVSVSAMVQLKPSSATYFTWDCMIDRVNDVYECLHGGRHLVVTSGLHQQIGPFYTFLAGLQVKQGAVGSEVKEALSRLRALENGSPFIEDLPPCRQEIYSDAVDSLEACWLRPVFAIEWLNDIGSRGFITEIRNKNPLARLILAHWGASLHALNRFWYAVNIGKNLVMRSTENLVSSDAEFNASINWTKQYVGLDNP